MEILTSKKFIAYLKNKEPGLSPDEASIISILEALNIASNLEEGVQEDLNELLSLLKD